MTNEEYEKACTEAGEYAGIGPEWNAMYELALLKRGLKIVANQPPPHPLGNDNMAPIPVSGERHQYPYPSWIVEA